MSKILRWLMAGLVLVVLSGCGGGDDPAADDFAVFRTYAQNNGAGTAPTVQDYIGAGVTGVTAANLDDVNEAVAGLDPDAVDSEEELQRIADRFGLNTVPTAQGQNVTLVEDASVNIVLAATDIDEDDLTYSIVTQPANGTLSGTAPNIVYTPAANYFGTDSFTFKVNDGEDDSVVATVEINVTSVNDAPVSQGQNVTLAEDASVNIVLAATDIDEDDLAYSIVTQPTHGTLSGTAPNMVYVPAANYFGTDSFIFKVNDGEADSAVATVEINVTSVNDAPVSQEQNVTLAEDASVNIVLAATDIDEDDLAYSIVTQPTHGTLSGTAPNMVYTPTANYFGTDSFTFKVNDGEADSAVATVEINVTSVNDAPVLSKEMLTVSFDEHNVSTNGNPNATYGVDMDNDGDIDFLVSSEGEALIWYENDGSQNFTEHNISTSLEEGWSAKAIDLEGDGDKDILLASSSNVLVWYENDGSQNFTEHNISTAENRSWWIDSGDIDQDGDIDILSTDTGGQLKWWENDGDQNFTEHNLSTANYDGSHIQMNDLNNDGHNDIVVTLHIESTLLWYENDGNQNFTEHNISSTLDQAFSSFIIDMDNDGDKDIIGTGWNMIVYYENDGNQNFTEHNITTNGNEYVGTNAIDIDGDGDIDIFTSSAWFENDGNMNFSKHELSEFAPYFDAIDLDGDGDIDIISPYYWSSNIVWQENLGRTTLYAKENNTTVATVVASDVDGDRLTYSISGVDADKFDINATTGVLTFKDAPDYETPTDEDEDNRYEINIAVTDGLETDDLDIMVVVEDVVED